MTKGIEKQRELDIAFLMLYSQNRNFEFWSSLSDEHLRDSATSLARAIAESVNRWD